MKTSKIEWCDATVNGQMGCGGCELWAGPDDEDATCYAAELVGRYGGVNAGYPRRFGEPRLYPWRILEACRWSDLTGTERPQKPWLDGLPRLNFLDDMGDTYTEQLDDPDYLTGLAVDRKASARKSMLCDAWEAVADGGHWLDPWVPEMTAAPAVWQVLTKRPRRMRQAFERLGGVPANFWPMTSVTKRSNRSRLDELLKIPDASVLGLSYEPMLEEVDLRPYADRLSWAILGGESGPRARETPEAWFRSAIEALDAGGCRVFVKQAGKLFAVGAGRKAGPKGGDPAEWPEFMRRREMPAATDAFPPPMRRDDPLPASGQGLLFDLVRQGIPSG
jgi:protein gp37